MLRFPWRVFHGACVLRQADAFAVIVARYTDRYFALAFRTLQNVSEGSSN